MFWCPKVLRSHVQICSIGTALITISQFFVSEDLWLIDLSALYHYLRWMSFSLIRFFLICWISLVTHVNDGSKAKSQIAFIVVSGNPEILQCLVDNEVSHTLDHPLRSDHFPVVAEIRWSSEPLCEIRCKRRALHKPWRQNGDGKIKSKRKWERR